MLGEQYEKGFATNTCPTLMLSTTEALDYDFTVVLQLRYKKRDYSIQITLKGKDISKANSKVRRKH